MGPSLRAALAAVCLTACNSAPAPAADASTDVTAQDRRDPSDAADITDAPPVTDRTAVADIADAPPVTDRTAVADITDVTDAADATDVTDAQGADVADASTDVLINGCPSLSDPVAVPDGGVDGGVDTWSSFARGFFAQWCTRCHSSALSDPSARGGAPPGFDWDQEAAVRMRLDVIRRQVGVVNAMPFNAPLPTCEERRRFVAWIDRGAP